MALGMTKDSMVDLQSMVHEHEKIDQSADDGGADTLSLLTTGQSLKCSVEYEKLAKEENPNPAAAEEEKHQGEVVSEEATKARASLSGETSSAPSQPATPQTHDGREEEKKQDAYGHYSGFANDYEDYSFDPYVVHYSNRPPQTLLGGKKKSTGFLCCVFPWLRSEPKPMITQQHEEEKEEDRPLVGEESVAVAKGGQKEPLRKISSVGADDDDLSTASVGSDKLGEKLSERERQAVLARLRLAQPDRSSVASSDAAAGSPGSPAGKDKVLQKGLLGDIPNITSESELSDGKSELSDNSTGTKGILKRQSTVVKTPEPQTDANGSRRSLFPTYETNKVKKNDHHISFAPMARVVTVKSQKEMTPEDKSSVWWQKWDYEDFRKTGRIITRVMLEGGSEIWLASNRSWQHQGASKQATLKSAMSLSEKSMKIQNGTKNSSETADLIRSTSDKWWHKFGHSRRGLEHIASIKEGSERQANVRHAIRAVLDEQRRQKAYMREDPEKLRMVSIHNTSWARDLSIAAGASDADAVKSNFDKERKSREFYLLKMARSNSISSKGKHVPAFMKPSISTTFAHKLDANTQAQIMYRRTQQRAMLQGQQVQVKGTESSGPPKRSSMPPLHKEPIHDPGSPTKDAHKDLAKRAAGFSHVGAEQPNMAAVLSGMGAVPKSAPVGA